MTVSTRDLERRYRNMPDEEVVAYCRSGTLLPAALEVARAEARRRGLDIESDMDAGDPDDFPPPGDLVTVARFLTVIEAQVLEARLLAEGIGASVTDAHQFQAMQGFNVSLQSVRVQVPEFQVALAQQVLAAVEAGDYALEPDEPGAAPAAPAAVDAFGISAADIGAYAHHPYYERLAAAMLSASRRWAGFNPAVLAVGSLWFFYRRLPLAAFAYLLGAGGIFLLLAWIGGGELSGRADTAILKQSFVASLITSRVVAALVANNLYLRKARAAIASLPLAGLSLEERLELLRQQGGPSVLALALAVVTPLVLLPIINA
ncbi:MAG: DUF2007 domain-containing protein [Rhizobium sp.]|nr:DUF2007 domain-containing protein [Rhizobium sp.]